jgi:hypothetical protein
MLGATISMDLIELVNVEGERDYIHQKNYHPLNSISLKANTFALKEIDL